jgi:hypothetical protein
LGTKLQLTEPSEIRFNGVLLSFKAGKGIYENAISGFVDYGTFEFTDLEGTLYSNSIELTPVSFPSSWGPLSHGSSSELIWLGDVLGSTETMQLTLTSQVQTESEVFTENDNGAFSMLLSAGNINDLPIGAAIGALERVSTPALMEGTNAGGTLTGRYRALDYAVNITE